MLDRPERLFLPSGAPLFAEGDEAVEAYLVIRGRIELFIELERTRRTVQIYGAGDMFGESALAAAGKRSLSAVAIEDAELLVVSRAQMSKRIEVVDPVLRVCLSLLLERYSHELDPLQESVSRPGFMGWPEHFGVARDQLLLEMQLRQALSEEELELYFQPIVRLKTRKLAGFEVLLRWNHPERGLLPPGDFIPLAESTGLITDVTAYSIRMVGRHYAALLAAGASNPEAVEPLSLNINVSSVDLQQEAFAATTVSTLCDAGVDPERIRIEVTESVLMQDADRCTRTLTQFREQGMQVAIDDFGTGYSSLNYLNALPIDILKLDGSFARSLLAESSGRKIIGAIVQLGGELQMSTVAEGIEQEAEAELLTGLGCELGQGFLFGKPRSHDETMELVRDWVAFPAGTEQGRAAALRA